MKVLRKADHKQMPWKNGRGVTVEIAIHPSDASVDNFDWRISTASVVEDGEFSVFTDIDRTLCVLEGSGIDLTVAGSEKRLTPASEPFRFAADAPTSARLIDEAITDLNIMTKRGAYQHQVSLLILDDSVQFIEAVKQSFLFIASGSIIVKNEHENWALHDLDCVIIDKNRASIVELSGNGIAYLITLMRM